MFTDTLAASFPLDCRIPHLENNTYLYGGTPPRIAKPLNPAFSMQNDYKSSSKEKLYHASKYLPESVYEERTRVSDGKVLGDSSYSSHVFQQSKQSYDDKIREVKNSSLENLRRDKLRSEEKLTGSLRSNGESLRNYQESEKKSSLLKESLNEKFGNTEESLKYIYSSPKDPGKIRLESREVCFITPEDREKERIVRESSSEFYQNKLNREMNEKQQMIREEIERERREFIKERERRAVSRENLRSDTWHSPNEKEKTHQSMYSSVDNYSKKQRSSSKQLRTEESKRSNRRSVSVKKQEVHHFKPTFAYQVKVMDNKSYTFANNVNLSRSSKFSSSKHRQQLY